MDESERDQLARRLSALTLNQARKEIYGLDHAADMKYYRNARWHESHTLFTLPNAGLAITLVESVTISPSSKPNATGPAGSTLQTAAYRYERARVELLERPAHKRGGEGRYQLNRQDE